MSNPFDQIEANPFDKTVNPFDKLFATKPPPASAPAATTAPVPAAGGDQLVGWLQQAGFKGEALKTAWGIAKRESSGRPTAYNPNRSTGDDSYGLFQINMLGNLGPSRRKQFGISKNEDLYDPIVNAKAAFRMSGGGKDFGAWGIGPNAYRKMPALDLSGFPGAQQVVQKVAATPPKVASTIALDPSNPFAGLFAKQAGGGLAPVSQVVQGNSIGAQAVKKAATQLGKPYVFGSGPDTSSFDCSDLVQWSYRQLGIEIPRDTWGQQKALPLKSWRDLQPGDPIYRKSGGHVVIYAGNGQVIAAPHTGTVVQYQPLSNFPQDAWEIRSISVR
jgi:cell wall-associated NlpC family hydrolase